MDLGSNIMTDKDELPIWKCNSIDGHFARFGNLIQYFSRTSFLVGILSLRENEGREI